MRRTVALLCALALVGGPYAVARAEDPPTEAPAGDEAARAQHLADQAARDALVLIRAADVSDVMAGLSALENVESTVVTDDVVATVLARLERHVAQYAGHALAKADPTGAVRAATALVTADSNARERHALLPMAHEMLAELPGVEVDELLAHDRSLRSKDDLTRATAIEALGRRRSPLVVDSSLDALGSKNAMLRNVACVALGRVGDKRATIPLLGKLDQSDGGTAGYAAIALGRIEDDRIFPNVVQRMSSGNLNDKGKALVASARPQHTDDLVAMLRGGSNEKRMAAAAALGKLAQKERAVQEALLSAMLGDSDEWVRIACFSALGRCADGQLADDLDQRMGQKDRVKRMMVYELAGDVKAKNGLPHIEKAAWGEKSHVLRRVAQDAFWRIGDPESILATENEIRTATGKKAARAAEFLGMRRNRNGFDLSLEMLERHKDGSSEERAFEYALEMQTGHLFGPDPAVWKEWIEKLPHFFEKEQAAIERTKWREEFLKENKEPTVTPQTEQTVQRALDYLARHQNPDGAFDQQHFLELCEADGRDNGCPISAGARIQMDPVGMSGLCSEAFFGAGYTPKEGRYRSVLARAIEYLLSRQMPIGDYGSNDLIGGYNRPLALQAYAEAHAAAGDAEILPFIQRGVDFLVCIQAEKAGWRYRVVDNASDTSVVSWVLFGAKASERAGAHVRRSLYEGCDIVLRGYQTFPKDAREDYIHDIDPHYDFDVGEGKTYFAETGYQDQKSASDQATTPLGLMSRIILGFRRSHPFCIGSANKMLADYLPEAPVDGQWKTTSLQQEYPMYFFYYGTLSMHQMGGRFFREWNKRVKEILPLLQRTDGCRRGAFPAWSQDAYFSELYTTAIGALTLETYYRYAPILQD